MSEHDNTDPVEPVDPVDPDDRDAAPVDQPVAAQPVADAKPRWRDRVFRMRAVAAVAVAGVILGATGGAVTTALIAADDHGRHDGRFYMGQFGPAGMPAVPPYGRMRFPSDEGDGQPPVPPLPPASEGTEDGTDDGTDSGSDEPSSLSQS